jgi:prepilin-type N-terminal cleavage/methylation domain-containing protein
MMDRKYFLKRHRRVVLASSGFSLVELLIALLVFVVAAGASFATFQASAQLSETSRNRMIALQDAKSVLEEIKVLALQNVMTALPAQLSAGQFNSQLRTFNSDGSWTGQSIPALGNEQITLTSNPQVVDASTTLATFTVTVGWVDARGRLLSLSLTTQKSSY